jgi:hypothetical protein
LIYGEATLAGQWKLPFHIQLKSEDNIGLHKRSYIHYLADHQPLVAAKVAATKWSLEKTLLDPNTSYTSREYLAGVGIMTCIITNMLKISKQTLGELDAECVEQLRSADWRVPTTVNHESVIDALQEEDNSDLKFLDFPNSSILQLNKQWKGFEKAFDSKPKFLMWTDTSVTYPTSLHGEKYSELLGETVTNKEEYVRGISNWLYKNFGYSLIRAAFRDRNAVYFSCAPGKREVEMAHFPAKGLESNFIIKDESTRSLDEFF